MKVNGFDVDIGVEGVLVEENRASSVMGHVEPTSKKVMINILSCFLLRDDVPPACNLHLPFRVGALDSSCRYSDASARAND